MGRTNYAFPKSPKDVEDIKRLMSNFDLKEAFLYHTVARDSAPEEGNKEINAIDLPMVYKCWSFETAFVVTESVKDFHNRALKNNVKILLINPLMRNISLNKSPRILELSKLLQTRRIPLILGYWNTKPEDDVVPWYDIIEYCNNFPDLPIIVWEWRTRSNRPLFDALALTKNLYVPVSILWQAQMVDIITHTFGAERLVFSLGLPGLDPGSFQQTVRYADITEEAKHQIAYKNIRNILDRAEYSISSDGKQ